MHCYGCTYAAAAVAANARCCSGCKHHRQPITDYVPAASFLQGKYWTGKFEHDSLYGHKAGVKSLKLLPSHGMLLTGVVWGRGRGRTFDKCSIFCAELAAS
jgi:hypothetical protein